MARLAFTTSFEALHGTTVVRRSLFGAVFGIEGPVVGDFVAGVDDQVLCGRASREVERLGGEMLDDVLGRATLENVARYLLAQLRDLPVHFVTISLGATAVKVRCDDVCPTTWAAELAFKKGVSKLLRGRPSAALEDLTEATHEAPRWAAAHNARGRCLRRLSRIDEALRAFATAVDLDPSFGEAVRNSANAVLELGNVAASIPLFDRAVSLLPDSALALNNRGYALQCGGEFERALEDHDRAVLLDPTYAEAFRDRAAALEALGRSTLAAADIAIAVDLDSQVDAVALERAKLVHTSCEPSFLVGDR